MSFSVGNFGRLLKIFEARSKKVPFRFLLCYNGNWEEVALVLQYKKALQLWQSFNIQTVTAFLTVRLNNLINHTIYIMFCVSKNPTASNYSNRVCKQQ